MRSWRLCQRQAAVVQPCRLHSNFVIVLSGLAAAVGIAGMLGLGAVNAYVEDPTLVTHIAADKLIVQVSSGSSHTAALTSDGEVRSKLHNHDSLSVLVMIIIILCHRQLWRRLAGIHCRRLDRC